MKSKTYTQNTSLRIKHKAQNFASWMFSEYAFKIGRKKGNDFLFIVPLQVLMISQVAGGEEIMGELVALWSLPPSALVRHTTFLCAKISLKWDILSPLFGTIVMFCAQVISIPVTYTNNCCGSLNERKRFFN